MSRPRGMAAGLLLGLALCAPGAGATAQEAADPSALRQRRAAEIQARLDSLAPLYERARERVEEMSRVRRQVEKEREIAGTDTVRVGPMRVVTPRGQSEEARALFGQVWEEFRETVGEEAPALLSDHLFSFQWSMQFQPMVLPDGGTRIQERRWRSEDAVRYRIREAVGRRLFEALEGPGKGWFNYAIGLPPSPGGSYEALVLSPSQVARGCIAGDLEACWAAVGAVETATPLESIRLWYGPDERVDAVRRLSPPPQGAGEQIALREACLNDRDVSACEEILAGWHGGLIPLGGLHRGALVQTALEMGGAGAYARLAEATRAGLPPRDMLAAVSGGPADAVMERWRGRVMAAAPDREAAGEEERAGAFFWILLFTAFATRSTRWRLA